MPRGKPYPLYDIPDYIIHPGALFLAGAQPRKAGDIQPTDGRSSGKGRRRRAASPLRDGVPKGNADISDARSAAWRRTPRKPAGSPASIGAGQSSQPALLTSTSSRPNAASGAANSASMSSARPQSARTVSIRSPDAPTSPTKPRPHRAGWRSSGRHHSRDRPPTAPSLCQSPGCRRLIRNRGHPVILRVRHL